MYLRHSYWEVSLSTEDSNDVIHPHFHCCVIYCFFLCFMYTAVHCCEMCCKDYSCTGLWPYREINILLTYLQYATLIGTCRVTAVASCTHSRPHSFLQTRRARPARECRMWDLKESETSVFLILIRAIRIGYQLATAQIVRHLQNWDLMWSLSCE